MTGHNAQIKDGQRRVRAIFEACLDNVDQIVSKSKENYDTAHLIRTSREFRSKNDAKIFFVAPDFLPLGKSLLG